MLVSARAMQNERAIAADKARENEIVVRQAEHKLELEDRATQRKHQQDMLQAQCSTSYPPLGQREAAVENFLI
jgi:hypothetical protein